MNGPEHYQEAERILAEIEGNSFSVERDRRHPSRSAPRRMRPSRSRPPPQSTPTGSGGRNGVRSQG